MDRERVKERKRIWPLKALPRVTTTRVWKFEFHLIVGCATGQTDGGCNEITVPDIQLANFFFFSRRKIRAERKFSCFYESFRRTNDDADFVSSRREGSGGGGETIFIDYQ